MENDTPSVIQKTVKFTPEEMKEISDISAGFDEATIQFGRFYLRKLEIDNTEKFLKEQLDLLEKQEKAFLDKITAKYGEGTYDPTTGIFTPKKLS